MQVIALTSHAACHSFFTVRRVVSVAARRSTAERLTRAPSIQSVRSGVPSLRRRIRLGRRTAWRRIQGDGIARRGPAVRSQLDDGVGGHQQLQHKLGRLVP